MLRLWDQQALGHISKLSTRYRQDIMWKQWSQQKKWSLLIVEPRTRKNAMIEVMRVVKGGVLARAPTRFGFKQGIFFTTDSRSIPQNWHKNWTLVHLAVFVINLSKPKRNPLEHNHLKEFWKPESRTRPPHPTWPSEDYFDECLKRKSRSAGAHMKYAYVMSTKMNQIFKV